MRLLTPSKIVLVAALSVVVLCAGPGVTVDVAAASAVDALEAALLELDEQPENRRRIEGTLRRMATGSDKHVALRARAALAASRRAAKDPRGALAEVQGYSAMRRETLAYPEALCYLEHGACIGSLGQTVAAFRMLDYAYEHAKGLPGVYTRIAFSDVVATVPDLDKALAYLREAVNYGDRWFYRQRVSQTSSDLLPPKPYYAEWLLLRSRLGDRIKAMERLIRIARWGLDYVLYLEAQQLRGAADPLALDFTNVGRIYRRQALTVSAAALERYGEARKLYTQLLREYPESVYGEAARLYRAVCTAKMGDSRAATKEILEFFNRNPTGLYRGEALRILGHLALQDQWQADKAGQFYERAVSWCEKARSLVADASLYAVPEKSRAVSAPSADWQQMNSFGVITPVRIKPGAVVNRTTSKWYLNYLQEDCGFALGFVQAARGDWDAALDQFKRAAEMDPLLQAAEREDFFNALRRLQNACERQVFVGHPEENRGLGKPAALAMAWADFCHMRENFALSSSLYGRLYSAASAANDGNVAARAAVGLILTALTRGQTSSGQAVATQVLEKWPRAAAAPYVCFLAGHTFGHDGQYEDALTWYRRAYEDYPRSRVVELARYYEIFKGLNPKTLEDRRHLVESFIRDFPESQYRRAVEEKVEFLVEFIAHRDSLGQRSGD